MFRLSKPNIYTAVVCANLNQIVDIYVLFYALKLDETVLAAKIMYDSKGPVKNNKNFFNQISLIMMHRGRKLSVKIFINGKIHISGARYDLVSERALIQRLIAKMDKIHGHYTIPYTTLNGFIVDAKRQFILGSDDGIMFKRMGIYYFSKGEYVFKVLNSVVTHSDGLFFVKTYEKHHTIILNRYLQIIGHRNLQFFNHRKNVPKKGSYYVDKDDYLRSKRKDYIFGKYEYTIDFSKFIPIDDTKQDITVYYSVCDYPIKSTYEDCIGLANLNTRCQIVFPTPHFVDLQSLHVVIAQYGYKYIDEPERYHGSNIKFFYNVYRDGFCHCKDDVCVCFLISLHIFSSGSILIMGCKSKGQLCWVYKLFESFLIKHGHSFCSPFISLTDMEMEDE